MSEWIKLDPDNLPDTKMGPFVCTNNLSARNAHDRMSHVYLTSMFHKDDGPKGPVTAFAEPSWQAIWGVTHYFVVEPPEQAEGAQHLAKPANYIGLYDERE